MEPSLQNIKEFTKEAFNLSTKKDYSLIEKGLIFKEETNKQFPIIAEMFFNDFCYEWNKNQCSHFINNSSFVHKKNIIPIIPSVWLIEWGNTQKEKLSKDSNNHNDIRKTPFNETIQLIEQLTHIFSICFRKTPKKARFASELKDEILGYQESYGQKKKNITTNLLHFVYDASLIKHFSEFFDEDNNKTLWKNLISNYYGKFDKKNEQLFSTFVYSRQGNTIEDLIRIKEEALQFQGEDLQYWKFFKQIDSSNFLISTLKNLFDINKKTVPSVVEKIYIKNNYYIFDDIIPNKESTKVNKPIKV